MLRDNLIGKVEHLDSELEGLISKLRTFSQEELDYKPNDSVWSPTEVLQHMILSEKLSLAYCKKKLSFEPKLRKAGILTWLNGKLISWSLMSPFKFKAPAAVGSPQLSVKDSFGDLVTRWEALRNELKTFIINVPELYIDREVYKHPFGMRMSLSGMLDFYQSHFRRHRKQVLKRLS